jgi:hypothetical protein
MKDGSVKLKDCPFCGQPASLVGWGEGSGYRVHAECNSCRNATAKCSCDSQAAAMWNRRAKPECGNCVNAGHEECMDCIRGAAVDNYMTANASVEQPQPAPERKP